VGVGQSEVEIAGVADTTVVVMVPEAGDEVQTMKSGVMEIADVFVVNKADRDGAESFARLLRQLSIQRHTAQWEIPVLLTRADTGDGVDALGEAILSHHGSHTERRKELLFEKALHLLREQWLRLYPHAAMRAELEAAASKPDFNLYRFVAALANRNQG
jgi:LAO/AO transport system kinase